MEQAPITDTKARQTAIGLMITAQSLALTADTVEEWLRFSARENKLREDLQPPSPAEEFEIAQGVTRRIMEYEA